MAGNPPKWQEPPVQSGRFGRNLRATKPFIPLQCYQRPDEDRLRKAIEEYRGVGSASN